MSENRKRYDLNGREYTEKMRNHLESVRLKYGENGFINLSGRPTKKEQVQKYRKENPAATMYRCAKDLGIDPKTVRKWWEV